MMNEATTVNLLRTRCNTPIAGLKYIQTHKPTGLSEVASFSAHAVMAGFPGHPDPANPSLGDLVALLNSWNQVQHEWEYALCQCSGGQPATN